MIGWLRAVWARRPRRRDPWGFDLSPIIPPFRPEPGTPPPAAGPAVVGDPRLDPAERAIPMSVQIEAEETLNAMFGLPEAWRCPCGGRPFITEKTCPRCGRKQAERWS